MIALNGAFCWFNKLSEFWQTALVAAGIFTAGLTAGLLFHSYQRIPAKVSNNAQSIVSLEEKTDSIQMRQENFAEAMTQVSQTLDTVSIRVSQIHWRVEVQACYEENATPQEVRDCINDSRAEFPRLRGTP